VIEINGLGNNRLSINEKDKFKDLIYGDLISNSGYDKESLGILSENKFLLFNEIDNLGLILVIISEWYGKGKLYRDIESELIFKLNNLGIKEINVKKWLKYCEKEFNLSNVDIDNGNDDNINDYLNLINGIVSKKDTKLSDKVLKRLINFLKLFNKYNSHDIFKKRDELKNKIIKELYDCSNINSKVKGRKKLIKNLSPSDYRGEFSGVIESNIYDGKIYLMDWITKKGKTDVVDVLLNNINKISMDLYKRFKKDVESILLRRYNINYERQSAREIDKHNKILFDEILSEFSPNTLKMYSELKNKFQNIDIDKISNIKRFERFNDEYPLMKEIKNIINDNTFNDKEKQLGIEKLTLDYEMNWFKKEMSKSVDARSVILHDIHSKMNNGLNYIVKKYKDNNYSGLIDIYKESILKRDDKKSSLFKNLFVLLLLGNKQVIGVCFKILIEELNKSDGNLNVDRTEFLFKLGNRIFKLSKFILDNLIKYKNDSINDKERDLNENDINWRNYKIDFINHFDDKILIDLLDNVTEEDRFVIGDTLMRIMEDKTEVIYNNIITENDKKKIMISIKDDYIKKLIISSINVTQLPMLIRPNEPYDDGKYLPYLHGEISHIYNTFDMIVKKKFDLRDQIEKQHVLIDSIIYLNNTRFTINNDVLDFIVGEWLNEDSKFFNGENKLKIIEGNESNEEKRSKQSHNSNYWRYNNTINIAMAYKDNHFYLPTFADFRGRIYTLSNYLTYQGDDLSRSLLLFSPEFTNIDRDKLNKKGLNYLYFYFANLAGKDKLGYEDKINWSKENIMDIYIKYITDKDKFLNEFLNNIKEPLQFISILFALINVINAKENNKDLIINNPILFDASCSGLQHLSALTREIDTAIQTNLVSLPDSDDIKNDYYLYASSVVQDILDKSDNAKFRNIKLNRKIIKKSVMTIPYNITKYGIIEQMKDHFQAATILNKKMYVVSKENTKDNTCVYLLPREIKDLGNIIYDGLIDNLPSLKILSNYLDNLINIILKLDMPVIWITPLGLKISLSTVTFKSVRTRSSLIPYGKPVTISIPTKKLNSKKIKSSFMPNLIHSLDASNIHLLCNNLKLMNIQPPLYTIHDCFASTPNNMAIMENEVKKSFIEIYFKDQNYIEKMHNNLIEQIRSYKQTQIINGEEIIEIDNKVYKIPNIPQSFLNQKIVHIFIEGIKKSKFFIS
jgi:hypothetical protein